MDGCDVTHRATGQKKCRGSDQGRWGIAGDFSHKHRKLNSTSASFARHADPSTQSTAQASARFGSRSTARSKILRLLRVPWD